MKTLLLHCRAGFENEVSAEITDRALSLGLNGYARATSNNGYVEFICDTAEVAERLINTLPFNELIFPRQWVLGKFVDLVDADRVGQLLPHLKAFPQVASVWLEVLDTNEGKSLSTFCRKFEKPLLQTLKKIQVIKPSLATSRLLLTFFSGQRVFVGYAPIDNSAKWPMGIIRLKFPYKAPSRSTLKLEEAWHHFIPKVQWDDRLAAGMMAIDLGAAPGGWTWQLVNRYLSVIAVDNGPMDRCLMESGLVQHLKEDGFTFKPKKPVDWMVCDIVEKPARTASLVEEWFGQRWCKEAIINFKLPMKQRYQAVKKILSGMQQYFDQQGINVTIQCKQLYHDREEVTCHLRRLT